MRLARLPLATILLFESGLAQAQDPPAGPEPVGRSAAQMSRDDSHIEWGLVPLVGGDTDIGIGVGQLSNVARVGPHAKPYVWKLETALVVTFKLSSTEGRGGSVEMPYQEAFVLLTVPHFPARRLRFTLRPSFMREIALRYYGLGNASLAPDVEDPLRDRYLRGHPTFPLQLRWTLGDRWSIEFGQSYTENWFEVPRGGTLDTEMRSGTPDQQRLLGQAKSHGVYLSDVALLWDSRDNEISPTTGSFLQLRLRGSPALGDHVPYTYAQVNLLLRRFFSIYPNRVVLALRAMVDGQFGDIPFYELARYEDTNAFGGLNGVRGIPGQRYYGRFKAFGTTELRVRWFDFVIKEKHYSLGSVFFSDFGRVFTELTRRPELDGAELGLKWGAGGGLRIQKGETFVVRGDVAWSPDARPLGAYVSANQTF